MTISNTLPELGSEPEDPLLVDLVRLNPVSVRLRNAICGAARDGTLPLQRVSEYLAAGGDGQAILLYRITGVGRKSIAELHDLVLRSANRRHNGDIARSKTDKVKDVRGTLCNLFSDVTVRQALGPLAVPVRLSEAVEETGIADKALSAALSKPEGMDIRLLRHRGVGKTTITDWRRCLDEVVSTTLMARGLSRKQVRAGVELVLEGNSPDLCDLEAIANALAREPKVPQGTTPIGRSAGPFGVGVVDGSVPSVDICVEYGLEGLDERSRQVIQRRYGLSGPGETLEEIGSTLRVTRERVRQIQVKALGLVRARIGEHLNEAIRERWEEHWKALVEHEGYLQMDDATTSKDKLSPSFRFALEVLEITVFEWLDRIAHRVEDAWVSPHWCLEDFNVVRRELSSRLAQTQLPCALSEVAEGIPRKMVAAAAVLSGCQIYGTYVVRGHLTLRVKRALRLHATLGTLARCTPIVELAAALAVGEPKGRCSTRDCEIVMRAHAHLFLEVTDGTWAALGAAGTASEEAVPVIIAREPTPRATQFVSAAFKRESGVSAAIAAELRIRGPTTLGVLRGDSHQFLPSGTPASSISVLMLKQKEVFCRPLPGVYALHHQVPSGTELLAAPPAYVLQEGQARLYALARRAGEPWGTFPLWLPETEYLLCDWAQRQGKRNLLDSLLAVSRIDQWPDKLDRNHWRELAAAGRPFSLHFPMRTKALAAPELEKVLAACLYIRDHGYFSWISGNRVLKKRVGGYRSTGLLAILVATGALASASDWQQPHLPGTRLDKILGWLEVEYHAKSELTWKSDLGQALIAEALAVAPDRGWVTKGVVRKALVNDAESASAMAEVLSPLEKLLAEKAEAEDAEARETLLRSLSADTNGAQSGD